MKETIFMLPVVVRRVIAKRTKKTYTINILSKDTDALVISNLGGNLYTPPSNLQYFVEKSSKHYCTAEKNLINESVASNPNINFKTAEKLVNDEDENVRQRLARNSEAIKYLYIQEKLVDDGRWVKYFIGRNTKVLHIIDKLSSDPDKIVRAGVAINETISREKQMEFSTEVNNPEIIINLLENPNVISEILDEYANNSDALIRRIVAGHLNTRIGTLENLKKDKDKNVRRIAKYNLKHKNKIRRHSWKFIR